jgi:hypothetical protein
MAEVDHAAPRQDTIPRDPVIPPRDAAAQAQVGLPDDLDSRKLDRCPDSHGASLSESAPSTRGKGQSALPSSRCEAMNGLAAEPTLDPLQATGVPFSEAERRDDPGPPANPRRDSEPPG